MDELRRIARSIPADPRLAAYLEKVHHRAYAVTDADVQALRDAGVTEDEIFEQTVAAAIAEGLRRHDAAERAISGVGSTEPHRSEGADLRGAGAGR